MFSSFRQMLTKQVKLQDYNNYRNKKIIEIIIEIIIANKKFPNVPLD